MRDSGVESRYEHEKRLSMLAKLLHPSLSATGTQIGQVVTWITNEIVFPEIGTVSLVLEKKNQH